MCIRDSAHAGRTAREVRLARGFEMEDLPSGLGDRGRYHAQEGQILMHFIGRMRIPNTLCHMLLDGRLEQCSDALVRTAIPQLPNGVKLDFWPLDSIKRCGNAALKRDPSEHETAFGMFKQSEVEFDVSLPSLDIERSFLIGEGRNIGDDTFIALCFHRGFEFEPSVVITCWDNVANNTSAMCDWRIVANTFVEFSERLLGHT